MNVIELAKQVGGVADDQTIVLFHEELEAVARAIRAEALEEAVNAVKKRMGKHRAAVFNLEISKCIKAIELLK